MVYHVKDPFSDQPTVYLYDHIPGGVGLSDRVYEMNMELFVEARRMLAACPCENGCPSCVGAESVGGKKTLIAILDELIGDSHADA